MSLDSTSRRSLSYCEEPDPSAPHYKCAKRTHRPQLAPVDTGLPQLTPVDVKTKSAKRTHRAGSDSICRRGAGDVAPGAAPDRVAGADAVVVTLTRRQPRAGIARHVDRDGRD